MKIKLRVPFLRALKLSNYISGSVKIGKARAKRFAVYQGSSREYGEERKVVAD